MRVLVCGGRDYNNYDKICEVLDKHKSNIYCIIHGAAKGADYLAQTWALVNFVLNIPYHAEWKKYGNKAGPIRNQRMIDEGHPNLVIAFPGGKGTADMVRRAKANKIDVMEIRDS